MAVGLITDRKLDAKVAEAEAAFAEMAKAQKEAENTGIPAPALEKTEAKEAAEPEIPEGNPKKAEGIKVDDENTDTWKHKYDVLIGKYNAEIPRMAAENKELKSQIAELQEAIKDVQSKVVGKEASVKKEDVDSAVAIIQRELGEDVSSALNKLLDSKTATVPKQYEEKVSRLEQKVENADKRQTLTEKQAYTNTLNQLIPNLLEKNKNPKWLDFLTNTAPFSRGKTYQQLLDEANDQMDASGVAEIFNAFYGNPKSNGKKHDIEEFLEPGKPKPKSPNIEEKKIYTKAEIKQFDQDVVRGKYTGKDELRQKIEAEHTSAILDGRVR